MNKPITTVSTKSLWMATCVLLLATASPAGAALLTTNGDFGAPQTIGSTVIAPWTPNSTGGDTISTSAQSPFTNLFANNGVGVNTPQNSGGYFVQNFTPYPVTATGTLVMNADFENTSTGPGYYDFVVTNNANGLNRSAAVYINDTNLYAESSSGLVSVASNLAQNTWYNLQLTLDLTTKTYSGEVTPFGGAPVTFSGLTFVNDPAASDHTISAIYTDLGTSLHVGLPGTNDPVHNIDNFAISAVPEPSAFALMSGALVGLGLAVHMRVARKNVLARYGWLHR